MAVISILLPSLRPEAAARVVKDFSLTNSAADYEIIVVSPFKVNGEKVVHIFEKERRGVMFAMNQAYKVATGEYIVGWSDDALPENDCLEHIVDFVQSHDGLFIAGFRLRNIKGKELEQWNIYGKLHACWFCVPRKTLDAVGGLFDPAYKNFWADPDLSMRVWDQEGEVGLCPNAWITVAQIDDKVKADNLNSSFDADAAFFFDRWHDKFGKNLRRIMADVSVQIPHSFGGKVRAILRKIPYLKRVWYALR